MIYDGNPEQSKVAGFEHTKKKAPQQPSPMPDL
jgi:hypothetical protein